MAGVRNRSRGMGEVKLHARLPTKCPSRMLAKWELCREISLLEPNVLPAFKMSTHTHRIGYRMKKTVFKIGDTRVEALRCRRHTPATKLFRRYTVLPAAC